MSKMKMTPAIIKKAGKELEGIIKPETKDGKDISLSEGKVKDLKPKIIEAAELLTEEDEISETLKFVIGEYGIVIGEEDNQDADEADEKEKAPEKKEDDQGDEVWTYEQLKKLPRKKLEKVALKLSDPLDLDNYKEKKDLLIAVCDSMGLSAKEEVKEPKKGKETVETDIIEKDKEYGSVAELVTDTKKLADLKDIVTNNKEFKKLVKKLDDFTGIQGPRQLKKEMFKILGVEPEKKAPEKKKKEDRTTRYTRNQAVIDAVKQYGKKGFTYSEILKKSDVIYVEKGGNSNPTATTINKAILDALINFNLLVLNDKKYKLVN